MNIAFDAKRAYSNNTGLGQYSRTLINSLLEYYPLNKYFLCTPKVSQGYKLNSLAQAHVIIPEHFSSSLLTSVWRSSWIKKDLERLEVDLYHGLSNEIPFGISKTKIKTVVTIHDLIFEWYPHQYNIIDVKIYQKKFRYACLHADKIIAISQQTKKDIIQFYKVPPAKISVCYQSCNPAFGITVSEAEKYRIKQLYNLPDQFFLYVGSIIERKNLLTICKAIRHLNQNNHASSKLTAEPVNLVVIGEGRKYKEQVRKFIIAYSLQLQIIFLSDIPSIRSLPSFQSSADFPAIYQQALCLIYPSIYEGFGIPVVEALWSKIPVITSKVSSLPEAGGAGAIYVDPMNEKQIADAMLQIIINNNLRNDLIKNGGQHAQNFTQQRCVERVVNEYKDLF